MNSSAQVAPAPLAPRYEALFNVSDALHAYSDIDALLSSLPFHLHPVVDFDYLSVFLQADSGDSCWYVPEDRAQSGLRRARHEPAELNPVRWAVEHQQPAVFPAADYNALTSASTQWLNDRGLRSGCAIPMTSGHRRLGGMFLGSVRPLPGEGEELRFLPVMAGRVAAAIYSLLRQESDSPEHELADFHQNILSLCEEPESRSMFEEIVGSSAALRRALAHVSKVATGETTVLITGESGTGKELIAQAIHKRSRRSSRPFIRVNCAAISPALIASELFGHEKGSFTGALQRHTGRFELANGGTIFLDEIGEIPPETQIALLRVLQEREFERVGGTRPVPVDVRVIAATNRDLMADVSTGRFREDLYYRLNVFPIRVPALRDRRDDIFQLVGYFARRFASKARKTFRSIERRTLECLQAYDWPGNIRELQNIVERAVILCEGETLSIDQSWLRPMNRPLSRLQAPLADVLVSQEREIIQSALEETQGRVAGPGGAAAKLGMPRTTLESRISRLRINKHQFRFSMSA